MKPYILITPAKDEEEFIENTIQSVISQNHLPMRWIIVNDGSVDRTGDIIKRYAEKYDFLIPLDRPKDQTRNFGSKATAIKYGYDSIRDLKFEYIGNLDADVTFDSTHYEKIIQKFEENEKLGVAAGVRYDNRNGKFIRLTPSSNSAGGPTQFFRRECYDQIGGYLPLKFGGIDAVAEVMARKNGWEVRSFPEIEIYHHRSTGSAGNNIIKSRFRAGIKYYVIGYHPLFIIPFVLSRIKFPPPIITSILLFAGYFWGTIRHKKEVPDDFVKYLRSEQLNRLRNYFTGSKSNTTI